MATGSEETKNSHAAASDGPTGFFDSALAGSVKESAQQIWLAGMGAFAKAQAEGRSVFEALVKEGASLQQKTQGLAEAQFGDVAGKMSSVASEVQAKAGEQWGKLESIFEERTAKAMQKLGVPSSKDMQAMQNRIDALEAQLASQRRSPATKARSPAGQSVAGQSVAEKSVMAKSVAGKSGGEKAGAKRASAKQASAKRSNGSKASAPSVPKTTASAAPAPNIRRRPNAPSTLAETKPTATRAPKRVV